MFRFRLRSKTIFNTALAIGFLVGGFCFGHGLRGQDDAQMEIPDFENLLATLSKGSLEKREQAAAMLIEYPDRIEEFANPLSELFVEPDASLNRVAESVFKYIGENAIPSIEAMYHPERNETAADNKEWRKVCGAISAVGEPARETFEPKLLKLLDESADPNLRTPAILALTGFDGGSPRAISKIGIDFENENFNVTLVALRLVIKTGPAAHEALEPVRKLFTDGNLSQRTIASTALGALGIVGDYDPLPELKPLLDQFYLAVRERSLLGVGLLGPHAASLEPRVREMMMDTDSNLEAVGAYVLWQITGNTSETVPRLIELSKQLDFELAAIKFLGEMGCDAESAVDYLCERSRNIDYSVRNESIAALSRISPEADSVKIRVRELSNDPHPVVRLTARLAESAAKQGH